MTALPDQEDAVRDADTDIRLETRAVETADDVMGLYRGSPVGDLLAAQNLGRPMPARDPADLLIITCMDPRVAFEIAGLPAFQLRTAGATPMPVLSNVAFAVGVVGVRAICVVTHTDCAMTRVGEATEALTGHLVERERWPSTDARAQSAALHRDFRLDDPLRAAWAHARFLAGRFPSCLVAPLLYRVADGALLQIERAR